MFCFHFYPMFVYSIACCCKRYFTIKNVTIHCSHGLLLLLVLLLLLLFVRSCDEFSSCFDCVCVELSIVTTLVDIASLSWSCHVRYVRAPIHEVWGCVLDWPSPLSTPLLHASTNRHTHTHTHHVPMPAWVWGRSWLRSYYVTLPEIHQFMFAF